MAGDRSSPRVLASDGVGMFVWPDVHRFFDRGFDDLRSVFGVADDCIVEHLEFLAVNFRFKNFRPFLYFVAGADALVLAKELQHREQFAVGIGVALDGRIHARSKHLLEIRPGHPARRDVITIGLGAELRIKRERNFGHVDKIIKRIIPVLLPGAILFQLHQALQTNVAHASGHPARLHGQAATSWVAPFDSREARDTLFRRAGGPAIICFLVRAGFHALARTAAALLVHQPDSILRPFVNRVARTRRKARRITAVIANAREIKEPRLVLWHTLTAVEILALLPFLRASWMVLVTVWRGPLFVSGQIAQRLLRALGADIGERSLENGLAFELPVRAFEILSRSLGIPGLAARIQFFEQLEQLHIPMLRIAAIRLGLDVVPPHVLLALRESPGGLAGHGATLAANATVDVKNEGELLFRISRFVGIFHLPPQLPVIDSAHVLERFIRYVMTSGIGAPIGS